MNPETNEKPVWHFGIIFVASCFLFAALLAVVKLSVSVPAIDADRAAVRAKALAEIHAAEVTALTTFGWVDRDRELLRLPIEMAMNLYGRAAQDPVAARADLMARAEKSVAPLAAKPSAFE